MQGGGRMPLAYMRSSLKMARHHCSTPFMRCSHIVLPVFTPRTHRRGGKRTHNTPIHTQAPIAMKKGGKPCARAAGSPGPVHAR